MWTAWAQLTNENGRTPIVNVGSGDLLATILANPFVKSFTTTSATTDTPSAVNAEVEVSWFSDGDSCRAVWRNAASLETWEIVRSGGVWGTWVQLTDGSGVVIKSYQSVHHIGGYTYMLDNVLESSAFSKIGNGSDINFDVTYLASGVLYFPSGGQIFNIISIKKPSTGT